MGLLSSRELGLLPLMIAPSRVFVMRLGGKRPHSEWLAMVFSLSHILIKKVIMKRKIDEIIVARTCSIKKFTVHKTNSLEQTVYFDLL